MMLPRPLVPLGEMLSLSLHPNPVLPEASYPIAGVFGFGRGMIRRPPIVGQEVNANQLFRIHSGQFIYSKLKAFEGAFALVTEAADGHFVSNEFPTFDFVSERLDPSYLGWYFKQERVWRELAIGSKGIGARRERLHPERLLEHSIPLPPIDEQRLIVARLDAASQRDAAVQQGADDVASQLGAAMQAAFEIAIRNAPRMRMGDVAPLLRRPVEIDPDARYQALAVRSFGRGLFEKPDLIGSALTWQKLFRIECRDIVFSNIKAWEGAFAVARQEHHGKVGSHRYLTCVADPEKALPDFVWYYLQSPEGLEQVQAASPGSADRNRTLSQTRLNDITVPVPSLDVQRWFGRIQGKVSLLKSHQEAALTELDRLLPAMLDRAFA